MRVEGLVNEGIGRRLIGVWSFGLNVHLLGSGDWAQSRLLALDRISSLLPLCLHRRRKLFLPEHGQGVRRVHMPDRVDSDLRSRAYTSESRASHPERLQVLDRVETQPEA